MTAPSMYRDLTQAASRRIDRYDGGSQWSLGIAAPILQAVKAGLLIHQKRIAAG